MTEDRFLEARCNLGSFVRRMAALHLPQGFIAVEDAPSSYPALRQVYYTEEPLPVYAGESDNTIYLSQRDNYAFRAWHDALHVRMYRDFTLPDELVVAAEHINAVSLEFGYDSPEATIMAIDTAGQALRWAANREHVPHQLNFVRHQLGMELV